MTGHAVEAYEPFDPFDLPDWLGTSGVEWSASSGLRSAYVVRGLLHAGSESRVECDLVAVDEAYPAPVAGETDRVRAHRAWHHGEVDVTRYEGRLTLLVPGTRFDTERVVEALSRLARSVGASPHDWSVRLVIGRGAPGTH